MLFSSLLLHISVMMAVSAIDPPYIRIRDDLDEPGIGFCIDIAGFGADLNYDLVQLHSCKPADSASDQQFMYDAQTNRIIGAANSAADGLCLVALCDSANCEFKLEYGDAATTGVQCAAIEYSSTSGELRYYPGGIVIVDTLNPQVTAQCIVASPSSEPAGQWLKRRIFLQPCRRVQLAKLKEWDIIEA
mmetsp:Transcript_11968/g.18059  ORF Transcript_11968/g.18059 Transcript_11968/m.18059 type:complete len:189 (+) Transcript_11968:726-1292(+)